MSGVKQNSTTVSKIYHSRLIILKQLESRGFNTEEWNNFSINDVQVMYNNKQLDMLLNHKTDDKKIYVKYHLFNKLSPHYIYDYVEDLYNIENVLKKEDELIIISKTNPNDSLINELTNQFNNNGIYVNIYNLHRYLFNILEHTFVPHHKVLNEEEKVKIYKKYNILRDNQLPEISRFDPVAQTIGLRPGELCEITRKSQTSVLAKYYRLCH